MAFVSRKVRSRRDFRSVHCSGGCDCSYGTRIISWECAHACLTPVTDSMLSPDLMFVKKSCYSGSDPETRVSCAKGHPMTATSELLNKYGDRMGLCGGLSLQKSRIMPYSINPCQSHAKVDLTADSSRESNLGWDCSGCFLANAHGEPLCSLSLALTYHSRRKDTANLLYPSPNKAAQLPDGPLRRHLRFGATLGATGLKKYRLQWPRLDTMMHLMAEFAYHLFADQALDPVSRTLYPVYDGTVSCRAALAGALCTLWVADIPGFKPLFDSCNGTFRWFQPERFHTEPWYAQVQWVDPQPWRPKGCAVGQRKCKYCGNREKEKKRFFAHGGRKGDPAAQIRDGLLQMEEWDDVSEFEDDDMAKSADELVVVNPETDAGLGCSKVGGYTLVLMTGPFP